MSPRAYYCRLRCIALIAMAPVLALVGCSSVPQSTPGSMSSPSARSSAPKSSASNLLALPKAGSGRGGYYQDDGPGDNPPEGLLDTPDAEPKIEPYLPRANRPYVVFGKTYTPITDERPFKQRGIGSWYGKKFHGQKTSSGEPYDMYKMTAAHPTLPIPSYVRVTNMGNGKQIIVRVNDRGPFHSGRIIDLSYTAALKLGYLGRGSSELEVERLLPAEIMRLASMKKDPAPPAAQEVAAVEVVSAAASAGSPSSSQPTPEPIVTASPSAESAPGFYLQLGAYTQAANAESARVRLSQSAAGMLAPMQVVEQGALHRLYSGPYASRAEAAAVAAQLQDRRSFKPLIVQR